MTSVVCFEDDPNSRLVINLILTRVMELTDVTIFEDSTDFSDRLAALPAVPDIIFLDIQMKPYSGFEVLRALRLNQVFSSTRIVALTASVMNDQVEELQRAGFDGVIGKPVNREVFPNLVERIMQGERVWNPS